MASKQRNATNLAEEGINPASNPANSAVADQNVNGTAVAEDDENFGEEFDDQTGSDDSEAPAASETAAALSAALPTGSKPRKSDGKTAIAVRLNEAQQKRVRVRAMLEGMKPSDYIASLVDKYVKDVKITDAE